MAGRGRGLTLPAWMTNSNLKPEGTSDASHVSENVPAKIRSNQISSNIGIASNVGDDGGDKLHSSTSNPPRPPAPPPLRIPPVTTVITNPPMPTPPAARPIVNNVVQYPRVVPSYVQMPHPANVHFQPSVPAGFGFQQPIPQPGLGILGHPPFPQQNTPQLQQYPLPPAKIAITAPAPAISDPNNDAKCWSEHRAEDGRRYWYNKASLISTYDKPFCLKSPEERAIPPCEWKEYSKDGKKYYSNGKESRWTMPDDFRVWKEKIVAVEEKARSKLASMHNQPVLLSQGASTLAPLHNKQQTGVAAVGTSGTSAMGGTGGPGGGGKRESGKDSQHPTATIIPEIKYATQEEAENAFKQLLADCQVSTSAKMKEVMDLCGTDVRWSALKSQGERKQALAEYQTKRLKHEKEQQKAKARKHRDSFLMMLAEHTDIDARTRWRPAQEMLQHDARFKNVEDPREREELFDDFISELEKKEKDDIRKERSKALPKLSELLKKLEHDGRVTRRSTWADCKKDIIDVVAQTHELRVLEELDVRQSFQSFVGALEEQHRSVLRKKKEEYQRKLADAQKQLQQLLMRSADEGAITIDSRWKDVIIADFITSAESFQSLRQLFSTTASSTEPNGSNSHMDTEIMSIFRDVFDRTMTSLQEKHRSIKKIVKEVLAFANLKICHDSSFQMLESAVLSICGVREMKSSDGTISYEKVKPFTEEGEELEDDDHGVGRSTGLPPSEKIPADDRHGSSNSNSKSEKDDRLALVARLETLLWSNNNSGMRVIRRVFDEYQQRAAQDHEEELRRLQKAEQKFLILLEDNFYLKEHVDMPWDDAKKLLQRRSAYEALPRSDRKRIFNQYMMDLKSKLIAKTKAPSSTSIAVTSITTESEVERDTLQLPSSLVEHVGTDDVMRPNKRKLESSRGTVDNISVCDHSGKVGRFSHH